MSAFNDLETPAMTLGSEIFLVVCILAAVSFAAAIAYGIHHTDRPK